MNRVVRESKEKRRRLAQRKTAQPPKVNEGALDVVEAENETETGKESLGTGGMLPSDIVQLLAAREKYDSPLSLSISQECAHTSMHKHMNVNREMFSLTMYRILTIRTYAVCRKVFLSDSDDEKAEEKRLPKKKKCRSLG